MNTWLKSILLLMMISVCLSTPWNRLKKSLENEELLPECVDEGSICGYFQLNIKGLSKQPICRCKGYVTCPVHWDPYDKKSIMHGTDQYKYCNRQPELQKCTPNDISYTSHLEIRGVKILKNIHYMHCECPSDHLLIKNETLLNEQSNGVFRISTTYECKLPPVCGPEDTCMAITVSPYASFNTRHCTCSPKLFCPADIRLAAQKIDLEKGSFYKMICI